VIRHIRIHFPGYKELDGVFILQLSLAFLSFLTSRSCKFAGVTPRIKIKRLSLEIFKNILEGSRNFCKERNSDQRK